MKPILWAGSVLGLVLLGICTPIAYLRLTSKSRAISVRGRPAANGRVRPWIKVGTYNIARGRHGLLRRTRQKSSSSVHEQLRQIGRAIRARGLDMVLLNEVDLRGGAHGADQAGLIARMADLPVVARQPVVDTMLGTRRICYGNALLTRFPVTRAQVLTFPERSRLHTWTLGRMDGLYARVRIGRRVIHVAGVHLEVTSETHRVGAARRILSLLGQRPGSWIVLGDFNSVLPPGNHFRRTSAGENAMETLLSTKSFRVVPTRGDFTFPAARPSRRIDHILLTAPLRFDSYRVEAWPYSDHRAVTAAVRL